MCMCMKYVYVHVYEVCVCVYMHVPSNLTGLLLRETRSDSRQASSGVSLMSDLSSWMYTWADLLLSFWLWPCR